MATVLVVDDQTAVRKLMSEALERHGHSVREAGNARDALAPFESANSIDANSIDLVLLDIGLPGISGLEVLSKLQEVSEVPVILVTGRSEEPDRIRGLRMGADDYVVKPFSIGELMARVDSVLRRHIKAAAAVADAAAAAADNASVSPAGGAGAGGGVAVEDVTIVAGPLRIHRRRRVVELRDEPVSVTHREFELLDHLASAPGVVFSRDELLRDIWQSKAEWQDPATVTEHIRRLRQKLERDPAKPELIQTVRSAGYRFNANLS